jgi:hypothetical protein
MTTTDDDPNFDPIVDIIPNVPSQQHQHSPSIWFGLVAPEETTFEAALTQAQEAHVDFAVVYLSKKTQHLKTLPLVAKTNISSTSLLLRTSDWNTRVVGALHPNYFEATNFAEQKKAELIIRQEVEWAQYLSLPAVLLPTKAAVAPHARIFSSLVSKLNYTQLWFQVPSYNTNEDTWLLWNQFRMACDHNPMVLPGL